MDRLWKELWVASFLKSLAFSKHCKSSSWALHAFENICIKTGAEPFSKAIGFGHLPLSSSENPAPKVHSQEPTCTVTQTPNTIFLSAAACSSTRCQAAAVTQGRPGTLRWHPETTRCQLLRQQPRTTSTARLVRRVRPKMHFVCCFVSNCPVVSGEIQRDSSTAVFMPLDCPLSFPRLINLFIRRTLTS